MNEADGEADCEADCEAELLGVGTRHLPLTNGDCALGAPPTKTPLQVTTLGVFVCTVHRGCIINIELG